MANLNNTTSDQKNVSQDDSASSTDSCALHINLSNEESITNTKPNITKQLPYDTSDSDTENDTIQQMQVDHSEDEDTEHQCIKTYSLKLFPCDRANRTVRSRTRKSKQHPSEGPED